MSAGREISKGEALLIISGWRDSSALIKCRCEIAPTAFSMRGRIVELSGNRVRFFATEGVSEFVFDLKDDFTALYTEPRDFPEEAETDVCALIFAFSAKAEYSGVKDFIALSESR